MEVDMSSAGTISEIALLLLQAYLMAAKQAGLTEEQAKTEFALTFIKFMSESEGPIDEVRE
jgi:hypothetical protein